MGKARLTKAVGDYVRRFKTEDGVHYRMEHQDLDPAMRRVKLIQEAEARRGTGITDRRYVGSVPMTLIIDWCRKHGYTIDQWARNDGGIPGMMYPESTSGVKDKFMKYFLTREFSKLHTQHSTTRKASSRIIVPNPIGNGHGNNELRRAESGDS